MPRTGTVRKRQGVSRQGLRTEKPKPWHALRIGLKRFRYTVESLSPSTMPPGATTSSASRTCSAKFTISTSSPKPFGSRTSRNRRLSQTLAGNHRPRAPRNASKPIASSLLQDQSLDIWRSGLPTNGRVEAAALARLRATARAVDPHVRRTSQTSRIAVALFDALKRADSAPAFSDVSLHRFCSLRLACMELATRAPTSRLKGRAQIPSWSHDSSRLEQRRLGTTRAFSPLPSRGRTPSEGRSVF